MKKWCKFFFLGFFSHKQAKEGARRGFTNVFLGFVLALVFIWAAFIGGDMLPFVIHYSAAEDLSATACLVLANPDAEKRIGARLENGCLRLRAGNGEYGSHLLVNTLENQTDREIYSLYGFDVVVDSRPANALAEIEAYCISNDGKGTVISYDEYMTLSEVARLNFDFRLRYTGGELLLTDELVDGYKAYLNGLGEDTRKGVDDLASRLEGGELTADAYKREMYTLYFESYYPEITEYESSSRVPLLRNYYYHQYISQGAENYLFIFDDYFAASFATRGGSQLSFYGFFSELDDGAVVADGLSEAEAGAAVDGFIKAAYGANWYLNAYAYAMNTVTLLPFIALMLPIVAVLAYSVLRLMSVTSVGSLIAMLKIVGSFTWFSGAAALLLTLCIMPLLGSRLVTAVPLCLFFAVLLVRSAVFVIKEKSLSCAEQPRGEQTEE